MTDDSGEHPPADIEAAIARIERRGARIRAEQVERTLSHLRADGDLTADQRLAVERLSERLVDRLLAVPRRSLREAAAGEKRESIETALALFD